MLFRARSLKLYMNYNYPDEVINKDSLLIQNYNLKIYIYIYI